MTATLEARVLAGDRRAAARLMRLVDDGDPAAWDTLSALYVKSRPSELLGLTGSPGAGKSTLADRLIRAYRAAGERVGVVAVDPTSPFSGGAILGDRVRMQDHVLDPDVFVRSLATRGWLGGISRSALATVAVIEALGFAHVLLETVGVGQAEVDVARAADTTLVILVPGLGDDVQALKAGLMEVADVFVVNKADREGASRLVREVEGTLRLLPRPAGAWMPPVVTTVGTTGEGIDRLLAAVAAHRAFLVQSGGLAARRQARARFELELSLRAELSARIAALGETELGTAAREVAERRSAPYAEAKLLLGPAV